MKERNWSSEIEKFFMSNYFIIAIGVIAIITRFFWISRESIWLDEACSISLAQISGIQQVGTYLFHTTWKDPHPIFYYFVLHYWINIFGTSEVAIRSLSAIFGILVIVFTYYAGSKLIDRRIGILASILVLVNPLNLWYSQEARMYTLTSLLILLSSYFFFKLLLSERSITRPILYVLTSVILIYTDYVGIFVLGVHLLFGLFYLIQNERMELKTVLLCYAAISILYFPWIPNLYHKFSSGGATWMSSPTLGDGARTFVELIGTGRGVLCYLLPSTISYVFVGLTVLITLIILVVGIIISLRKMEGFSSLIAMTCFIPVIMFFISITVVPIFNSRQISGFVPEIALMIATGLIFAPSFLSNTKMKFPLSSSKIFGLLFMFIVIMSSSNVYTHYTVNTKEDWRSVGKYIEENSQSEDIILINAPYLIKPFNYYYNGDAEAKGISTVEELKVIIHEYKRIWMILSHEQFTDDDVLKCLNTTTHEITRKKFIGINVTCYEVR